MYKKRYARLGPADESNKEVSQKTVKLSDFSKTKRVPIEFVEANEPLKETLLPSLRKLVEVAFTSLRCTGDVAILRWVKNKARVPCKQEANTIDHRLEK